ncbi:LBF_2804 family protein [Halomonas sp.]|uniref:LBF_2804 family protein n=1 Tax=Halomonas sp. TaxID=1486246 RepID=UPI003A92CE28
MPLDRPDQEYAPSPGLAQRLAHRYISYLLTRNAPLSAPNPHAIKRIKRWTIVWAAIAGIISGTLIGGGEWWMKRIAIDGWSGMSLGEQIPYWIAYYAVVGVITAIEIGFLYWNSLRGVTHITRLAGLAYSQHNAFTPSLQLTVHGVARAALEYPSSGNTIYGINPHAYLHGWKLTLKALLYRLKISLSSFILRVVMRRVLSRLALRGFIPMLMGPLYAIWNAWIAWRVLHQAHLMAYGPPRIDALMHELNTLSRAQRQLIVQGIGELMMRNRHPHPNLVLLLSQLLASLPEQPQSVDIDWQQALGDYAQLDTHERSAVLESLTQAAILSGPYRGARKAFLREVYARCQTPLHEQSVIAQQQRWLSGEEVSVSLTPASNAG